MRAALVVLLVSASVAHAEPGFVWDAPASCPDGEDVRARVEQRLGAPLEIHGVEVAITRDGNSFVAHVDTRGVTVANQIRTLTSARCDELADAVAVVVARLASEWRRIDRTRVAPSADADTEDPRARAAAQIVERAASTTPPRTWGYGIHMMALSGIGTVPRVGVGGELAVFLRRKDHFIEAGFARWAPRSAYLVEGAPGRVDVGLDVITTRAGWSPRHMPIRAWLGAEVGAMRGQGAALVDPQAGHGTWFAVSGGVGVGWSMARYARLLGTFEVAVPTSRVHFALAESGNIYSSSAAAARCSLGLELGLP